MEIQDPGQSNDQKPPPHLVLRAAIAIILGVFVTLYTAGVVLGFVGEGRKIDAVTLTMIALAVLCATLLLMPDVFERLKLFEMVGFKLEMRERGDQVERAVSAQDSRTKRLTKNTKNIDAGFTLRIQNLLQSLGYIARSEAEKIALDTIAKLVEESKSLQDTEAVKAALARLRDPLIDAEKAAKKIILGQMIEAVDYLNKLFELKLEKPELVLEPDSFKNAYTLGMEYHTSSPTKDLPDLAYHNMSHLLILEVAAEPLEYKNQSGALFESYADILASIIKQRKSGQTAETADWIIAPGAVQWLKNEEIKPDGPPLRSLRAPGTAYKDDPVLGTDPQPDCFSRIYSGKDDNGGVHINSGIPSKAFYETAIRIGTERATRIWVETLRHHLKLNSTFIDAAKATVRVAGEIYGAGAAEQRAVQKAWEIVGVLVSPAALPN